MLMLMRSLSVSVDYFGLCAYGLLGRLRYKALDIHEEHAGLKRVKACLPSSLFKLLCARSLVKKETYLSKALACCRTSSAGTR